MIQCPNCGHNTQEIQISGPILYAIGVVEISEDTGVISAVSPFHATQTVKLGEELTDPSFVMMCPKCKYLGNKEEFKIVAVCIFSGVPTSTYIDLVTGRFPVSEDLQEEARRVFSTKNSQWEALIAEEDAF